MCATASSAELVAEGTEPNNQSHRDGGDEGTLSKLLTRSHVAEVNLYHRKATAASASRSATLVWV